MTEPLLKVRGLKIGATVYPPGEKPVRSKSCMVWISTLRRARCWA